MVPGNSDGRRIVKQWPGGGTGETHYQCEDGSKWYSNIVMPDHSGATAPPQRGQIVSGRIFNI